MSRDPLDTVDKLLKKATSTDSLDEARSLVDKALRQFAQMRDAGLFTPGGWDRAISWSSSHDGSKFAYVNGIRVVIRKSPKGDGFVLMADNKFRTMEEAEAAAARLFGE